MKGISGFTRLILITALGATVAAPLAAQSVADGAPSVSTQLLDLPANFVVFGKRDPNVHKATAVVNGQIITQTDIDQRVALILATNEFNKISEEQREQLRLQTLRALIDETLELQEATAHDITIGNSEIEKAMEEVAAQFQRTVPEFDAYITKEGSSAKSMRRQIQSSLAWRQWQRQNVQRFVSVSEDEVQGTLKRMMAAKGSDEIRLAEIWMSVTPATTAQVNTNLRGLAQQILEGKGSFQNLARTYSQTSTASVGGDMGWLRPDQLLPEIATVATGMEINQLVGPIPVANGLSIIMMIDKRKVLTADPRDTTLSLKQIEIKFPAGTTAAQGQVRAAAFGAQTQKIRGCGNANEVAKQLGAEVVDNDVVLRSIESPELQTMLLALQVGQSTQPFGDDPAKGMRVLVLCGREDPREAKAPSSDDIRDQMEQVQMDKRAQMKLRDLRRDAVIDYN